MTARRILLALFVLATLRVPARAAEDPVVADFDQTSPETFSFKDEKGSVLNLSAAYTDPRKGKHLGIRYRVVTGGWGGGGLALKGFDARGRRALAFDLKGEKGGEAFEIGLRDKAGNEKKFLITQFVDVTTQWQRVNLPLAEFAGIDLGALDNVSFGFNDTHGAGRVFIDDMAFEGTAAAGAAPAEKSPDTGATATRSLVDGFERTSPPEAYQVFQGDESTLALSSTRIVYEGDYAMELEYKFSTTRPWGSWVSAVRDLPEPLDWTGVEEVKLWVKGDGSENAFRFRFTEKDGETWEHVDTEVLRFTKWTLVTMPLSRFELVAPTRADGTLDASSVRSYQLDVLSPTAASTSGSKTAAGRVQMDQLLVTGAAMRGAAAAPPGTVPQLRLAVASIGNVDFSLAAYTEYFFTPEEKSRVNHNAKLVTNAKLTNYSARLEIASASQEFGDASAFVGSSTTLNSNRFPNVELPSFQVMANNVSPTLTNVTLGNLFVDYSPYTFSPVFGYKGLSAEGDYDRYNYHGFLLKHSLNSFSAGGRLRGVWPRWKVTGHGVYWEQNARLNNAGALSGGNLQPPASTSIVQLRRAAQDLVYNVEAEGRFWNDRLTLQGLAGRDQYLQSATIDNADPFNPIFSAPLDRSLKPSGNLWRGKVQTDGWLARGLTLAYSYRDVGTEYKPHYRQNPMSFDDTESDQYGHNARATQFFKGWVFSNEYDAIRRHSARRHYRHRATWGVGYYGYRGMDVAFNQEYRRETYQFASNRSAFTTDKNEKVIGSEFYVRTQLSPRTAYWIRPRQERIWHPATNRTFVQDALQMKFEFYIDTNAKFFVEHKVTRFGEPAFEPQGSPFDDNFTRVSFEVTF